MNRALRPLLLAMSLLLVMAVTVQAKGPAIRLTPRQETGEKVVSRGSGTFTYTVDGSQLCYTLSVEDLTLAPWGAHIHVGARRVSGAIVVHLIPPPGATGTATECITANDAGNMTNAELAAIVADPTAFYVNVHTDNYNAGEIRGQLR